MCGIIRCDTKNIKKIGAGAFASCKALTEIKIPDGVTEIEERAFCGCRGLTAFEIPDGVVKLGKRAFWKCEKLHTLIIGRGLKSIGQGAFEECPSLKVIKYAGSKRDFEKIKKPTTWKDDVKGYQVDFNCKN